MRMEHLWVTTMSSDIILAEILMKYSKKSLISKSLLAFLFLTNPVFTQSLESFETSLPLQFDTGNSAPYGLPSTIITIEGKSIPIILDTGAKKFGLALTKEALKKIHVHFTGKAICSFSRTGEHCYKEIIVPEVKLGHFSVKNVEGILVDEMWDSGYDEKNFKATEASNNGLVGYALLSQFNFLLDYKNSKLTLINANKIPTDYDVSTWTAIPFSGHFNTKLFVDGKLLTFSWDTGAIPSIISRKAAQSFTQIPCPKDNPYREPGSVDNCFRVELNSLTTMNNEFISNTAWFSVSDMPDNVPFDGLIGSNFYANHLVYFDFDKHKIYVKPVVGF